MKIAKYTTSKHISNNFVGGNNFFKYSISLKILFTNYIKKYKYTLLLFNQKKDIKIYLKELNKIKCEYKALK